MPKPEPHDLKIGRSKLNPTPQEPIQNFKPSFVSKPGLEVLLKMSLLVSAFGSHYFCNNESTHAFGRVFDFVHDHQFQFYKWIQQEVNWGLLIKFGIKEPPVLYCKLFPKEDVLTLRDYFMIRKLSVAMFCDELWEPPWYPIMVCSCFW